MNERPVPPDPAIYKIRNDELGSIKQINIKLKLDRDEIKNQLQELYDDAEPGTIENIFPKFTIFLFVLAIQIVGGFWIIMFWEDRNNPEPLHFIYFLILPIVLYALDRYVFKRQIAPSKHSFSEIESRESLVAKIEEKGARLSQINDFLAAQAEYEERSTAWDQQQNDYWQKLKGTKLENAVKALLEEKFWTVQTIKTVGDAGIDLICKRKGKKVLIQCKGEAKPLGVGAVRDAACVKAMEKPNLMVVVAPNGFTSGSKNAALKAGLKLLASADLVEIAASEADILH